MKNNKDLLVFSGNANPELAKKICNYLKVPVGGAVVDRFNDGEVRIKINVDVRGRDVFIIQPTCCPGNDNLMELLIMIDAIKRSSARRITAVIPYYGYSRQDRKDRPRVPITAKLVANLITVAGANRVLTMDLHAGQIQGFFDIPLDNLFAVNTFMKYFEKLHLPNLVVVSPDVGGIKMARAYAKKFKAGLAVVDKRRINDKEDDVPARNLSRPVSKERNWSPARGKLSTLTCAQRCTGYTHRISEKCLSCAAVGGDGILSRCLQQSFPLGCPRQSPSRCWVAPHRLGSTRLLRRA